jgi:alkylation response protein AidB-like acyl-CoA dehydrogenase
MDLAYSPDDERFRETLRAWLAVHAPEAKRLPSSAADAVEHSRAWQRTLHAAGYVGLAWPREYGGQAASPLRQVIFGEEYARAGAPALLNTIGIGILGPALIRYGSEEQKRRLLPRILGADDIWCQGFSEPGAGSDLASLRTRAMLDGDDLVVTGQKVWTSLAGVATWCFLLVRSDPDAPAQRGISYVLMDMRSPGVRIVPIRQITGKSHFSELFLDEVRIPRGNVIGKLGEGWMVAKATLDAERSGLAGVVELERHLAGLRRLASATGRCHEPVVRQQLAQLHIEMEALRYTGYRVLTRQMRGGAPGPESVIGKLATSEFRQRIMDTALALQGPFATIGRGNSQALDSGRWQGLYLDARAYTIGGGTSEIMRNIIAERALGLPRSTG